MLCDSDSDDASFESTHSRATSPTIRAEGASGHLDVENPVQFTPEEESKLKEDSLEHKSVANAQFATADYTSALQTYDKALATLPTHLDYEIAVLKSNIAACRIKLKEWKEAEKAATDGSECLERIDPSPKRKKKGLREERTNMVSSPHGGKSGHIEEVDDATAKAIESLEQRTGHTRAEVQRIRVKLRLRRAKAREEIGNWQALEGANEDYHDLLDMGPELADLDRGSVQRALAIMPARLDQARQREMGEMMGKLKDLGNGILRPFGLSTDNFKFEQQESGGYSMQFDQNPKC